MSRPMMAVSSAGSTNGASISPTNRHFGQLPHHPSSAAADCRNTVLQLQNVAW